MPTWKVIRSFILPFIVLVLVPAAIHRWLDHLIFAGVFSVLLGVLFMITGLVFLTWTNLLFVALGKGTLAPWDATENLVIAGPYRYVRNPMIMGVVSTLIGEALIFGSLYLFGWALLFAAINHVWFVFWEEPDLEQKFGRPYVEYKAMIPRWVPTQKPYTPPSR